MTKLPTSRTALALWLCLALAGCKKEPRSKPAQPVAEKPASKKPASKKPEEKKPPPGLPHRLFASAGEALAHVLEENSPRVLALGEFHQTRSRMKVRSATRRFTESMVPVLGPRASDLVVETWITEGKCGKQEKKVTRSVAKTTERPEHTESEIVTMLRRAKGLGVRPHILKAGCKDYEKLMGADGKVDYVQLLGFVTRGLQSKAEAILKYRARLAVKAGAKKTVKKRPAKRDLVVVYGGALHNDLYPYEDLEQFSIGAALKKKTGDRYVELDLYVPEYIKGDETLSKEAWYPLFTRKVSKEKVLLIQRGESSYILVLKKGVGI